MGGRGLQEIKLKGYSGTTATHLPAWNGVITKFSCYYSITAYQSVGKWRQFQGKFKVAIRPCRSIGYFHLANKLSLQSLENIVYLHLLSLSELTILEVPNQMINHVCTYASIKGPLPNDRILRPSSVNLKHTGHTHS